MFGGGADVSPALGMLKLLPVVPGELSSVEWIDKNPAVVGPSPRRRISHCAVLAGRHMVIYGGWYQHALRDVAILDLAADLPAVQCPGLGQLMPGKAAGSDDPMDTT